MKAHGHFLHINFKVFPVLSKVRSVLLPLLWELIHIGGDQSLLDHEAWQKAAGFANGVRNNLNEITYATGVLALPCFQGEFLLNSLSSHILFPLLLNL